MGSNRSVMLRENKEKKDQEGEMTVDSTADANEISTYFAVGQF